MRPVVHQVDAVGPSTSPEIVEFAPQFHERTAASWGWQRRSRRPSVVFNAVFPDLGRAGPGLIIAKKSTGEPKRMGSSIKDLARMSNGLRDISDERPDVAYRDVRIKINE